MKKLLLALLIVTTPAFAMVTDTTNGRKIVTGNGATTAYVFTFPVQSRTDVQASITLGGVSQPASYTTVVNSDQTSSPGGTVTFTAAPANGATVQIQRVQPLTQNTSYAPFTQFPAKTTEKTFDALVMRLQQIDRDRADLATKETADISNTIAGGIAAANLLAPIATGATTAVTLADYFGQMANVKAFGARGDYPVHDDAAAIQSAINSLSASTTGGVLYIPPGKYKLGSQLSIATANIHVLGYGAELVQTGTLQRGFSITAVNVTIEGVYFRNDNGAAEWNPVGGSTNARGIFFDAGSDGGKAINNKLENWGWSGITVFQSARVLISGNEVIGIGAAGGLVTTSNNNLGIEFYLAGGTAYEGARVIGNNIHDTAQGLFVGDNWENITIANNTISNIIGQHCMYLDSLRNAVVSGNSCNGAGQNGIKIQIEATTPAPPAGDGINITVVGNSVKGALGAGIILLPGQAGLTPYFYDVVIAGNSITDCGIGIDLDHAESWVIANNVIRNSAQMGIHTRSETHGGRITGNYIANSQQSAMIVQQASSSFTTVVEGNSMDSPCLSGVGTSDLRAITFLSTGTWIYKNNFAINASLCTSEVSSHASAVVKLGKNYFPGFSNNSIAGTLLDESTVFSAPTNGQTITPNCATTNHLIVGVAFATWTVGAPLNPDSLNLLAVTVHNTSGGAITTTWNAIFKLTAWTEPTNGNNVTITFRRDSSAGKWYEVSRTGQVPN